MFHGSYYMYLGTTRQKAHSGDPETEGMGSTAVLLLISRQVAWVAHVGDSRAYLYRNGRIKQLTRGVGAFFEIAYANEKSDRWRNSNQAISKEFYKGFFSDKRRIVTFCFTFVKSLNLLGVIVVTV